MHAAEYLRVSIALVYGHKIRRMSVEEKFREYKLVPDVLRVAPSEKAEVSLPWTYSSMHIKIAWVGNHLFIDLGPL